MKGQAERLKGRVRDLPRLPTYPLDKINIVNRKKVRKKELSRVEKES